MSNNTNTTEKPKCYTPNDFQYPLCKGKEGSSICKKCNLYEDMGEEE